MVDTPKEVTDDVPLSERLLDLFVFLPTGLAVTVAEELPRLAVRGRERLGVQVNSARAIGEFVVVASQDELKRRVGRIRPHGRPADSEQGNPVPSDETPFNAPPRLRRIPRPPVADVPAPERTSGNATGNGSVKRTATAPAPQHAAANGFATAVGSASGVGSATAVGSASGVRSAPTARSALFDRPATTTTQTQTTTQTTTQTPAAPTVASGPSSSRPIRAAGGHIPDVSSLAIPGFDTLSASQVVHRLDGLSRSELVATRAYELATRGRRTILSRVDQLLDERS
ncbi:MAG: hypothetical protein WCI26_12655 [Acidimicrobiales bacterium]